MIILVLLAFPSRVLCSEERMRVLNGIPVQGQNTGYNAVRYYAAIATRHGIPKYKVPHSAKHAVLPWYLLLLQKKQVEGIFTCSGLLMTPMIIETACHCVSSWEKTPSGYFRLPRINHHWENMMVVYIGVNRRFDTPDSMENVTPLETQRYFIHRDCAKYSEGVKPNKYDFGWIRVNSDWLSGSTGIPVHAVDFAPIYSVDELKRVYKETIAKHLVCLRIGFGHWKLKAGTNLRELSGVLRHGWGVVMSVTECYRLLSGKIKYPYVARDASWICASPFPKHNQSSGGGDSGGPITCDNHLVAVVSGTLDVTHYTHMLPNGSWQISIHPTGVYHPLYFSIFENALEYRQDFEEYIAKFEEGNTYVDIIRKKFEDSLKSAFPHNRLFLALADSVSASAFCCECVPLALILILELIKHSN